MISVMRVKQLEKKAGSVIEAHQHEVNEEYVSWLKSLSDDELGELLARTYERYTSLGIPIPAPPPNISDQELEEYFSELSARVSKEGKADEAYYLTLEMWHIFEAEGHPACASTSK